MTIKKTMLGTLGLLALTASPVLAEGTINVLTWEGYADPSFISKFEETSGCQVNATYVGSNDDFAPKLMAGGGVYDLITPSIDTTKLMIDLDFVEPLDTAKIEGWNDIYPKFLALDGIQKDGEYYGMPYSWGAIAFMYRDDAFDTPPTSIADLWREDLKGKISLWDDKSAIYVAARKNGDMNIYSLSDEQIAAAQKTLVEQKPLIRKYWATAGELVDLYKAGEVVISNTWAGYQSSLLADEGVKVTEFIPKEGAEGWLDSWMVVKGTPNKECAYKFLNMQLSELGQCGVANVNGYSAANASAAKSCMTPEQFAALHQDDPAYLDSLLIWTPLGDRFEAYTNAWNAVKAQ
ncbi:ABC transporter substrate-binding protein [Thioclava marina]|uniref:ABC transporter substrate-binding protein n=1 Tax=Thioclava marina TaxID=1915077 RepID=A0ABX3MR20_9RHOB|nr:MULTISPECIES: ABC transporter substrate-binding protein [Thioclava]OOY13989.1 ABC transporter substrate-binding protein [Thioclava marina]OOY29693.1 ABC transporter substrate-binding protein [Thioclava sp. L04-15]TNE89737.1 MAG: extracellular solute-binding protein [Paracoccaceae bacterium]